MAKAGGGCNPKSTAARKFLNLVAGKYGYNNGLMANSGLATNGSCDWMWPRDWWFYRDWWPCETRKGVPRKPNKKHRVNFNLQNQKRGSKKTK